jgi:hypothetical protein
MFHINTEDDYSLKHRGVKTKFLATKNEKKKVFVRYTKEIVSPILKKLNQTNDLLFLSEHSDAFFHDQCFTYSIYLGYTLPMTVGYCKYLRWRGKSLTKNG